MIHSIAHPTDFSPEGQAAFEHALYLALANRCRLDLLHVHDPSAKQEWDRFPHVRKTLQRWGRLSPDAMPEDILKETGVDVRKVEISDIEPGDGLSRFIHSHRPDLIVIASHGRSGPSRWLHPSVSTGVAREAITPTLILGPLSRPFVDSLTGRVHIESVLVPVDHAPAPQEAVLHLKGLVESLDVAIDFLHVGPDAPILLDGQKEPLSVRRIDGPVVETLLDQARQASMVVMPMAVRRGPLDFVRGSTTDRVVREVTCPVLALPATS
ncbi:hypothetical protein GCM10009087_03460 [Sphingomonas oligophenolica]|uniref:Universal stress protein n=1 Tax=Sphingomonas oligophenolica TaxID=301154 RepID=A0ABU9Y0G3_9SPHN